jgi:hypothetical protein
VRRLALVVLLLAGCTPAPPPPESTAEPAAAPAVAAPAEAAASTPPPVDPGTAWENRLGNLPPDAAEVIGRVEACNHFAGEDLAARVGADRDETEATMARLRCDTVDADAVAVRAMYGDRPDVIEALDMATDGGR